MAADTQPRPPERRYGDIHTELKGLSRCVIPMSDDSSNRTVEKLIALILVVTWVTITALLTLERISTGVPPYWLPFTALVFLLVGRLWDLEVESILPGGIGSSDDSGGDNDG